MKPVSETPTEAVDYAALTAVYGALLAGVAATRRGREPIERAELLPLAAATFALSKLVVHEKAESWLREPFLEERQGAKRPRGRRLRFAVGELLNCTRCTGAWGALALVALRLHAPPRGPRRDRGARRLGRQRRPPDRVLAAVRADERRAGRPGARGRGARGAQGRAPSRVSACSTVGASASIPVVRVSSNRRATGAPTPASTSSAPASRTARVRPQQLAQRGRVDEGDLGHVEHHAARAGRGRRSASRSRSSGTAARSSSPSSTTSAMPSPAVAHLDRVGVRGADPAGVHARLFPRIVHARAGGYESGGAGRPPCARRSAP